MTYSANSIATGVWSALVTIPAFWNLFYAIRELQVYRNKSQYQAKAQTANGRTKYPVFLRATFVMANYSAILLAL
jgi:hypothetical protein